MSIRVTCDRCGGRFQAKAELAGKQAKCPRCRATLAIPNPPTGSVSPTVSQLAEDLSRAVSALAAGESGTTSEPARQLPGPSASRLGDCPWCGEAWPDGADRCSKCRRRLDEARKFWDLRKRRNTRRNAASEQEAEAPTPGVQPNAATESAPPDVQRREAAPPRPLGSSSVQAATSPGKEVLDVPLLVSGHSFR